MVFETGLVIHPDIEHFGASPDGLVGDVGLIEIKCPNTWTHSRQSKPASLSANIYPDASADGMHWPPVVRLCELR
jgi:hypothetical protein